jgi:lytic murein transglycosylase
MGMMGRANLKMAMVLALLAGVLAANSASAACRNAGNFPQWLEAAKREALAQGISPTTLLAAAPYMTFDSATVQKDRGQGVFTQTFLQFSDRMVASYRLQKGASLIQAHAAIFARIEKQYGVPAPVLVAFWGLETDFGANIGNLPTLRSVTTLAYDCRRPELFRKELFNALRVIQRGDLAPSQMIGPWAGELGQFQFLPSHYYDYAVDFDGDGRRDLLHSVPDALASAANLLANHGWQRGQPWLREVRVPTTMPWEQADLTIQLPHSQWAKWGVTLANGQPLPGDSVPASLILPMGRNGPAFLAYPNFKAYLEWNQSLVYSTTAAYFATRLNGAPAAHRGNGPVPVLSAAQIRELQQQLTRLGYKIGEVDGKLGLATRAAVKAVQLKLGVPADSYPSPDLVERVRTLR